MLKSHSFRVAIVAMLFSVAGIFAGAPPAAASPVQITLNNLTFAGGSGSEVFTGSFFYDPILNAISSVNIFATGATDSLLGSADPFGIVAPTGIEPNQFAFSDAFSDFIVLNLPSGLSNPNYGFSDADISLGLLFSVAGFSPESASSGDFSVGGSTISSTPEPSALLLFFTGLLLIGLRRTVHGLVRSQARATSTLSQ